MGTGAATQPACSTNARPTRQRLSQFLSRTEMGSYRPGWGLCDSLTRREKRRCSPSLAAISRLANFALQSYAPSMAAAATLLMWFSLRSPELAEDFERLMASDRNVVGGSLDTMSDWRLTRPMDVPRQASESADYVLIAEIHNIQRWQQQAEARVESLEDDLAHLVSSRKMLVLQRIL